MKPPEHYQNREQTYLKHFFLDRYLERVAYIIGYSNPEFVYVDGFSGPWKSEDENFEDTSFKIALQKLRSVREGLGKAGKYPKVRCLFIEKDITAYESLVQAIQDTPRAEVHALCGEFEQLIPQVLNFVGQSFALFFIDPTGWTGFGLRQIAPILRHGRGEVIVNFMFDYINRFLDHPNPKNTAYLNELFGGHGWNEVIKASPNREEAIINFYCERMKQIGNFSHVTYTRVDKPTVDRTYFYLVYGTRHRKGLQEFRKVEKGFANEQERVRSVAKQNSRVLRTGQAELFSASDNATVAPSFEEERKPQLSAALARLRGLLHKAPRLRYEDALTPLLEMPLVWESDINAMIMELRTNAEIVIEGMSPRERTPKPGHVLVLQASSTGE